MRKPRRAASAWVDGLYTPRYRVAGRVRRAAPIPIGSGEYRRHPQIDTPADGGAQSIAGDREPAARLHRARAPPERVRLELLGEREVLAPLNANAAGWPVDHDRNYGPCGLSVATDRWDVR